MALILSSEFFRMYRFFETIDLLFFTRKYQLCHVEFPANNSACLCMNDMDYNL